MKFREIFHNDKDLFHEESVTRLQNKELRGETVGNFSPFYSVHERTKDKKFLKDINLYAIIHKFGPIDI